MTLPPFRARLFRRLQGSSLRIQLLSRSLLLLSVILLLVGILQYFLMQQFLIRNKADTMRSQLISQAREIGAVAGGFDDERNEPNGNPRRERGQRPPIFMADATIALYDQNSGSFEIVSTPPGATLPAPKLDAAAYAAAIPRQPESSYRIVAIDDGPKQLVVLQPIGLRGRQLIAQAAADLKPLQVVLFRQTLIFFALALFALLLGLLAFLPVLKRTLVPLSNMVNTVGQIDAGSLSERLPELQGQREIDRLAHSFNGMLARLEASFEAEKEAKEQMRRFIADASHELRTPLTSIHGFLEVLLRGAASQPDQLHRALRSMYGESERINKLVQDLLMLAKLDRSPTIQVEDGHMDEVIREMELQLRLLAGERSVEFQLEERASGRFDKDKIKQLVLNLFHNAIQHTDSVHGRIELSLRTKGASLELIVSDNGSGIPAEHLPHLFERFYRADSSRVRKSGGAGLGLSISQSIAELHGGTIEVRSEEGKGATFVVHLPIEGPHPDNQV